MNTPPRIALRLADHADRERISEIRHQVYAHELGQHAENAEGRLTDSLDRVNVYLVATLAGEIAGFVSVTPPNDEGYSIDKYFARDDVPLTFDQGLYEVRLLTVSSARRASRVAATLMYGAWRYVDSLGGRVVVCIGRREIMDMYRAVGLRSLGRQTHSGDVTYELMAGTLRDGCAKLQHIAADLQRHVEWRVPGVSFHRGGACYHGGAFFDAIGDGFDALWKKDEVINADVLDAWFDPAPSVLQALASHLPWVLKTSPPTGCTGMRRMLSLARGVPEATILPGAGSSDLIFLGLRHWLRPESRVLILDPMYAEYAHVLEEVVGCTVDRLRLSRAANYAVDCNELADRLQARYDCVVLVNPNSPTGQYVPGVQLEALFSAAPQRTRFWVDETYIEYAGASHSLERYAAASSNVVVCKSMSKAYALSGARCAYLCGPPHLMDALRTISPPWAVSLPGQIAACEALRSITYYSERWKETHELRAELRRGLRTLGWDVLPGCANFLLCHLPSTQPEARLLVAACRARGLFVRDVANMGTGLGDRALRVAVKNAETNSTMVRILRETLTELADEGKVKTAA